MANMQLQKTRMAETQTKTVMTQKQSLEVVQTLLHGGVSLADEHFLHRLLTLFAIAQQSSLLAELVRRKGVPSTDLLVRF